MKRYLLKLAVLMLAVLFLSCTAGLSFAADGKNYPGITACRADDSEPVPDVFAGGILNPSWTQSLHVYLPIVHDAGSIDSGWIKVFDGHRYQDITCDIWSIRFTEGSSGGYSGWSIRVRSEGSGGGGVIQQLDFDNDVFSNSTTANYISCVIPPRDIDRSGILAYRIVEY